MQKYVTAALRSVNRWLLELYYRTGLTWPMTHTERYVRLRPGDGIIFNILTMILGAIGIPLACLAWAAGWISTKALVATVAVLFLLPPLITFSFCEFVLRMFRKQK